jgi:transcriptional regulator with XRE-family HTH domain
MYMLNQDKLKEKMNEKGISVETLANSIGVDKSTLYRKLNGSCYLSIKEVERIMSVLDLSLKEAGIIFFG